MDGSLWIYLWVLAVLQMVMVEVRAEKVDIQREIRQIVRHHNTERRNPYIRAPYVMQMVWDERLAAEAQQWADRCQYRRPSRYEANNRGSNLYFELNYVHDRHSIHQMVSKAIQVWTRGKQAYRGEQGRCYRSCDYSQMVNPMSDKIGCAASRCRSISVGRRRESSSSVLVCFYSPEAKMRESQMYRNSRPDCSKCPYRTSCRSGLCARPNSNPVPIYVPEPAPEPWSLTTNPRDGLTQSEAHYIRNAHNSARQEMGLAPLAWDPYLEKWAKYVVSCKTDYPGPRHCYTNFARIPQGQEAFHTIHQWSAEKGQTTLDFTHGCRTPGDRERCNHNTNVQSPHLTSMACATKACENRSRQLVCVYDNIMDRPRARRRSNTPAPYRYPRRRPGYRRRRYYRNQGRNSNRISK